MTRSAFDPVSTIDGKRHRVTLGLRALDPAAWLQFDADFCDDVRLKRELLRSRPSDVLAVTDDAADATRELLAHVVDHLARFHPHQPREPEVGVPELQAAALLVQEDLCLLTKGDEGWVLSAACVCFPSRWRLTDKMGASVAAIHAPVPGYDAISDPVDSFLDRLSVDRPMWRTNWTLLDNADRYQPDRPATRVKNPGDWTFRVERQTLSRLPVTGAVVFTIRTYRCTLNELVAHSDGAAADLAAMLTSVGPDHLEYRAWSDLPHIIAWLHAHSASGS